MHGEKTHLRNREPSIVRAWRVHTLSATDKCFHAGRLEAVELLRTQGAQRRSRCKQIPFCRLERFSLDHTLH